MHTLTKYAPAGIEAPLPVNSSGQLVEKEIDSGNPPVTGNDEIPAGSANCV
jgi:hypothetical protein